MKSIFFDAGPVISLSMTNLLWLLPNLRKEFSGKFYIADSVKRELIDVPIKSKKFKFEALQVMKTVNDGILEEVPSEKTMQLRNELLYLANNSFLAKGSPIQLVHAGEIDTLAGAILMESDAVAIDERTTRLMIEDWKSLRFLMQKKLHTRVDVNNENLKAFLDRLKGVRIIRSTEIVVIAFEKGMLNDYLPRVKGARTELLDALLWGIKLNGCSISKEEIEKIERLES
jgi:transcriptional regulator of aromatic amino acid metabolism